MIGTLRGELIDRSGGEVIREDPGGVTFDSSTAQVPPTVNADPLAPITATADLAEAIQRASNVRNPTTDGSLGWSIVRQGNGQR